MKSNTVTETYQKIAIHYDNNKIYFALDRCSLGAILVAVSQRGICAITLADDPVILRHDLQSRLPHAESYADDNGLTQLITEVVAFIELPTLKFEWPLDICGTAFQQRVWRALQQIPSGHTASYTEIAQKIGAPKAVRAVAGACAANPLAVVIPCHRVVRSDGKLSGYRWGIERKAELLTREATLLMPPRAITTPCAVRQL